MRRVVVMRLAMYGVVAYVAIALLALQADDSPAGTSGLFHGQTPEKLLVAVSAEDGKVQSAYLRFRMTCVNRTTPKVTTIHTGPQWGDSFDHDGRAFSFSARSVQPESATRSVRYEIWLSGSLSEDQRTVRGHGRTVETWFEDGAVVDVCRSKDVSWTAYRGAARG